MEDGASQRAAGSLVDAGWRVALRVAYRAVLVYSFVVRPRRRAVFVAVWRDGRVLAIRNSYRSWLTLPAGGVHWRESPIDAAHRELHEEVGIAAPRGALHFAGEVASTCEYAHDACTFYELHLDAPAEPCVDRREVVWAGFMSPRDVLQDHVAPPVRTYLERRTRLAPA